VSHVLRTAYLRSPFPSLGSDSLISRGAAGLDYAISRNVVLKSQADERKESIGKLEDEEATYKILMEHRHPNIVHCILCVPEDIFLHRQEMTLTSRIEKCQTSAITPSTQERWIQQITSALAWIEHLGYAHGDLRP
jgi:hypothetical protein